MIWYKVTLVDFEIKDQLDKKLIKDFISLLVKLDTPVGLAMHTLPEDNLFPDKLIYYFSVPAILAINFRLLFIQYSVIEVPDLDLNKLKTVLGTME
jgi:hypothetical protein